MIPKLAAAFVLGGIAVGSIIWLARPQAQPVAAPVEVAQALPRVVSPPVEAAPQPVKTLAGRAYRAIPTSIRQGAAYESFRREAVESESWDAATVERYQIAAIRDSLIAAQQAPFYAKRFEEACVRPEQPKA